MPAPIITFYSYKGGTGRSMGVANTAWILASNGLRVLVVDWDLEGPGLHRYFHPFLPDRELRSSPGVINLMWEFATSAMDPQAPDEPDWYERLAMIQPYAMSVEHRFPGAGAIDFVPAGRQDHLYSTLVTSFDWNNFYERLGGGGFLEALKRSMRERYDYVLIDSRTGLSDTAGICTVQLPDVLVNCISLSTQAIDGAAAVAASVHQQRLGDQLRMFPVLMRVEDGEQDKLETSRDYARAQFGRFLSHVADPERYWGDVEVPYKSFYAYEEILATIGDRPRQENTILAASERIVGYLTDQRVTELGAATSEPERRKLLTFFQRGRTAVASDRGRVPATGGSARVFVSYVYDSAEHFEAVRELWFLLRSGGIDARLDLAPGQRQPDWPRWQAEQLRAAEVVVVVTSPAYRRQPEASRIRDEYNADPRRFLAVVLPAGSSDDLPSFLEPDTVERISLTALTPDGIEPLLRLIAVRAPAAASAVHVPVTARPEGGRRDIEPSLVDAARYLTLAAAQQWKVEATVGGLYDPYLLPLRWSLTRRPVASAVPPTPILSTGTSEHLVDAFVSLPRKRLILLGAPGTGKTVTAVTLVLELLNRRDADRAMPVPVLLSPASWNPQVERLQDWITERLRAEYPALSAGRYGADAAARLVRAGLIMPVLDGLDELPLHARIAAIDALDRETPSDSAFVVTSRPIEYEEAIHTSGRPLFGAAVLELHPVMLVDAIAFLSASGISNDQRWQGVLGHLRENSYTPLAQAFATPLMVWLAREIYRNPSTNPEELLSFPDAAAIERHLLNALIPVVYRRRPSSGEEHGPRYSPEVARKWLTTLAHLLDAQHTRDLAWWCLNRALPLGQVRLLFGSASVILTATAAGLLGWSATSLLAGLPFLGWLLGGGAAGAAVVVTVTVPPSPPLRRLRALRGRQVMGVLLGLRVQVNVTPSADPLVVLRADRRATLIPPLAVGLVVGLAVGLGAGMATTPAVGLVGGLIAGALVTVLALLLSLRRSAWAQFVVTRFWLAMRGYLPLKLLRFLDNAHRRGVLRRTGAVYQFRLAMLQDLLAHGE
jgi:hypothetical protein